MDEFVSVGFLFGAINARVERDGEVYYKDPQKPVFDVPHVLTVQNFEDATLKDPDHDWRIIMNGMVFQRQGDCRWVRIEENG